ncbi:MAG: hypothetical protein ACREA9_17510 [Pyrinomonadaceae bacterium]
MSKDLSPSFNYDGIDKDVKGKLINLAGQFNNKMRSYKKSWLDLGEIVSDAHELLSGVGRDGKFASWIESFLNVSRQTAYRYMWAWQRFGKCNSVEHFTTEALYELAGPNTPEKAVKEAIKLADKGKTITKSVSSELVEKHTVDSKATESGKDDRTDSPGKTPQETSHRPPGSGKDQDSEPVDFGACPNCGGRKWTHGTDGASCAKCGQPHGESAGNPDEDRAGIERSRLVKTIDAGMRSGDDLNHLLPRPEHPELIRLLKAARAIAKEWK